uniref:snRNA-activating protein complex subunit 4 n=1 Tax=Junco hyemalis TaxID=40217 RepID=A0A8C5IR60_JUNHY
MSRGPGPAGPLRSPQGLELDAERERIRREIEQLERSLQPGATGIQLALCDTTLSSGTAPGDSGRSPPLCAFPLQPEPEVEVEEDSSDDDDDDVESLPQDPETCLQMNHVYQDVIKEKIEEVELLIAQNRAQQKEIMDERDGSKTTKAGDGRNLPANVFLGHFMKPYFKDKITGIGPPSNEEAKEKAAQGIKSFEQLHSSKWKAAEKTLLQKSVVSDRLQRLLQPKLIKKTKCFINHLMRFFLPFCTFSCSQLPESDLIGSRFDEHDWDKISNIHFDGQRSSEELRKFWQNWEHPSINKEEWTEEELDRLKQIAAEHNCLDWQSIAQELGTNRTPFQCLQKYQLYNKDLKRKEWTKEEDQMLLELVQEMRVGSHIPYKKIAYYMEGRDSAQLIYRWTKSVDPSLKKGPWTPEEDAMLMAAVKKYKEKDWYKIRREVPGRSDAQCRDRYVKALHWDVKKGKWSLEEEEQLIELVQKHGLGRWSKIASELPHRTGAQCQSKWTVMIGSKVLWESCYVTAPSLQLSFSKLKSQRNSQQGIPKSAVRRSALRARASPTGALESWAPAVLGAPPALGQRNRVKTVSELLQEKRWRRVQARAAMQRTVLVAPQVLVSGPLIIQHPAQQIIPCAPAGSSPAAAAGTDSQVQAEKAPDQGGCNGQGTASSSASAVELERNRPQQRPVSLLPALVTPQAASPVIPSSILPFKWVVTPQGLLPSTVQAVLGVPQGIPAAPGGCQAQTAVTSNGNVSALGGTPVAAEANPPHPSSAETKGPSSQLAGAPLGKAAGQCTHLLPVTPVSAGCTTCSISAVTLVCSDGSSMAPDSCAAPAASPALWAVLLPQPPASTQGSDCQPLPSLTSLGSSSGSITPKGSSSRAGSRRRAVHWPGAAAPHSNVPPCSGAQALRNRPIASKPPSTDVPPQPSTSHAQKNLLDFSLISLEDQGLVKEWLSGKQGVQVPPLQTRLPYLPPFLCSIKTLSRLLLQKAALEVQAASLLASEASGDGGTGDLFHAIGELVQQKLGDNPAYLLLKARFLAAFTLPAVLATLSPPRVTTTVSAGNQLEESEEEEWQSENPVLKEESCGNEFTGVQEDWRLGDEPGDEDADLLNQVKQISGAKSRKLLPDKYCTAIQGEAPTVLKCSRNLLLLNKHSSAAAERKSSAAQQDEIPWFM